MSWLWLHPKKGRKLWNVASINPFMEPSCIHQGQSEWKRLIKRSFCFLIFYRGWPGSELTCVIIQFVQSIFFFLNKRPILEQFALLGTRYQEEWGWTLDLIYLRLIGFLILLSLGRMSLFRRKEAWFFQSYFSVSFEILLSSSSLHNRTIFLLIFRSLSSQIVTSLFSNELADTWESIWMNLDFSHKSQ
jgi:hypothetical protein